MPFWHGDRGRSARYSEGAALTNLLLEAESRGRANGHMDARPEYDRLFSTLLRGPRAALRSPDIAGDARRRLILLRWAQNGASTTDASHPQASALSRAMQTWASAEASAARSAGRRVRFMVRHMTSPPFTLSWGNSHQDIKFPGEPPVPNPFVVGVNVAADAVAAPTTPSSEAWSPPESDRQAGIRWLPGLPRFWLSHNRRGPPDAPSRAILRWTEDRLLRLWAAEDTRAKQGALGRHLDQLYRGTLPLYLYAQVEAPSDFWPPSSRASDGGGRRGPAPGPVLYFV